MSKLLKTYLKGCLFLLPLAFLPVTDSYGFGKNWLMFLLMLLGIVIWVVGLIIKKENKIIVSRGWQWLLGLVLWVTLFWSFEKAGVQVRTFTGVSGLGMMLSLVIWSFLWMQVAEEKEENGDNWLTAAGLITAISSLIVFLLPAAKLPIVWPKQNPIFSITADWSLAGSILGEFWVLVILGLVWIKKLFKKIKKGEGYSKEIIITAVLVLVLFLDIFKITRSGWNYLDIKSSWAIATESLKNEPLQGVGIGNFLEAFNKWRPSSFNQTKNWSTTFTLGANFGLQLWTELGIIGLIMGVMAAAALIKGQKDKENKIMAFLLVMVLVLTPINFISLMLVLWLLIKNMETKELKLMLKAGELGRNVAPIVLSIVLMVGVSFGTYWWTKIFLGEIYLKKSIVTAANNDGGATYNWQLKAMAVSPNNSEYRRIYSQTNLALAVGLISNKEITDEQKEKAAMLIQQAVREAKAAVSLDDQNTSYWLNLASIYRQLVGSIDGTADWSSQAYTEAVALDQVNPSLRLDYGGLLYATGNYDGADRLFEQVVTLKPDLANGWYNWAYTAKNLNKLASAVSRLTQAVSLVPVTSGDYETASKLLETWKKEYEDSIKQQTEQTQFKQAETLSLPEALPTEENEVTVSTGGLEPPTSEIVPTE